MARRPERPPATSVDQHVAMLVLPVRHVIHVRHRHARTRADACRAIGLRRESHQLTVPLRPDLQLLQTVRPVAHPQVLVLAAQHQLDRCPRLFGQAHGDGHVRSGPQLGPETAAHVVADDPHLVDGYLQVLGDRLALPVHRLGRGPDGQLVAVPAGHAPVRLQRRVRLHLRAVLRRHRHLRFGEPLLHISLATLPRLLRVLLVGEDPGRPFLHGLLQIHHELPLLVLHREQLHRVQGDLRRLGRHRRHVFPGVVHIAAAVHVGEHSLHPGQLPHPAVVDAHDAGRRVRRGQNRAVEHAVELHVKGVFGRPADLERRVYPRQALAHHLHLVEFLPARHGSTSLA